MVKNKYEKVKCNITLDRNLLKEIDRLKNYPRWKGNRSAVIEGIIEDYIWKHCAEEVETIGQESKSKRQD